MKAMDLSRKSLLAVLVIGSALLVAKITNAQEGSFKPGLIADVHIEEAKSGAWASDKPVGVNIGTFVDEKVGRMSLLNVKKDAALSSLFKDHIVGVRWSGYLKVTEAGDYVILPRINNISGKDRTYLNSCMFAVSLDGKDLVKIGFRHKREDYYLDDKDYSHSKIVTAFLDSGYHDISIWHHCGVAKDHWNDWLNNLGSVALSFRWKGPSDRVPVAVAEGNFYWK